MKKLIIYPVLFLLFGCAENKNSTTITEEDSSIVSTDSKTTTTSTVSGKVLEIDMGKDGYSVLLQSAEGIVYRATVSHSNLNDPHQYKMVTIGSECTVMGEVWQMNEEMNITVREIL